MYKMDRVDYQAWREKWEDCKNGEGYPDPTAYEAIKQVEGLERDKTPEDKDYIRFKKLLDTIFSICDLAGFHVEGRIVLKDKKSGRTWR